MRSPASPLLCAALVSASILAGCVVNEPFPTTQPSTTPPEAPPVPYTLDEYPLDLDHEHSDAKIHNRTHNIAFIAYHSCSPDGEIADAVGGYTDIAFFEDLAFVGHRRGFCILDVSDPAHPQYVGSYVGEPASDIEVSADGNTVFLATQRNLRPNAAEENSTEGTDNLPRGIIVVNVENRDDPTFESYYPMPTNGVHTAAPYLMDGRQLLFLQTYDWVPPGVSGIPDGVPQPIPESNAPVTQRVEVTELTLVSGKRVLERIGQYSLQRPLDQPFVYWFPHDSFAQYHPVLGKHLLYVAYWEAGLVILDVDDPANPALFARYDDQAPSNLTNQYHDVKVFEEPIAGMHVTVTAPETPTASETGLVRIFNTTDPANPVQIGTWHLPESPPTPGDSFLFSPHVFTLHEGMIYIGHYHGGVWVIDVSDAEHLRNPSAAGFFFPRGDEATQTFTEGTPGVWGAYFHDGYIYATESSTGVHVLQYAGDRAT